MAEQKLMPLSMMFRIAESWQKSGKMHQAVDMYFRLVKDFPDTNEAGKSQERLLSLAQELEKKGKVYETLGICERLTTRSAS